MGSSPIAPREPVAARDEVVLQDQTGANMVTDVHVQEVGSTEPRPEHQLGARRDGRVVEEIDRPRERVIERRPDIDLPPCIEAPRRRADLLLPMGQVEGRGDAGPAIRSRRTDLCRPEGCVTSRPGEGHDVIGHRVVECRLLESDAHRRRNRSTRCRRCGNRPSVRRRGSRRIERVWHRRLPDTTSKGLAAESSASAAARFTMVLIGPAAQAR